MKRIIIISIIISVLGAVFFYTAVNKLLDINTFRMELSASPILGGLANITAWVIPILELSAMILLIFPEFRQKGLYASLVLMTGFTIYLLILHGLDDQPSCSCGGFIELLSFKSHLFFNGACITLCLAGIVLTRNRSSGSRLRSIASITTLAAVFILGTITFTALHTNPREKTGLEGKLLPTFSMLLKDSSTYLNTVDIPAGKPFVIFIFSPTCPHCQAEMTEIIHHIDQLKNTNFYLVTAAPFNEMKAFYERYGLSEYKNITIGRDPKNSFLAYFKTNLIPYTAIYNTQKRLIQAFPGRVDINTLNQIAIN